MIKLLTWPLALMSLFFQSVMLALGQIWAHKVRSTLTTIGIFIGVSAVTTVIASITGMKTNVLSQVESVVSSRTITIGAFRPDSGPYRYAPYHKIRFEPKIFNGMLDHCPSIETFTFVSQNTQNIRFGEKNVENCLVMGINPSWHRIQNRPLELGRQFSSIDQKQAWQVCLINPEVRKQLQLDRDCINQMIFIGGRSFRIVGMVEEPSIFEMGITRPEVFIPFETSWKIWEPGMFVMATSKSPDLSSEAVAELRFFLRRSRQLDPGEPDTFRIRALEDEIQVFNTIAAVITAIASCLVGVSLLVGGVGIMNIMLVSVSERTREIGLRKAVGARPSAILLQFLIEAIILCLFGGLIGIAVGQLFTFLITLIIAKAYEITLVGVYIPLWAIGLAFGFSALVGVVFGFLPALKAAYLDPIEALRHE